MRTIGTFIPSIFMNLQIVRIAGILSILATLTLVLFFVLYYKDYVRHGQTKLQMASVLAIIGACMGFLREIKNLSLVFSMHIFRYQSLSRHIDTFAPWLYSVFILIFFITFYGEISYKKQIRLKRAIFFAIIGTFIMGLLRTFLLLNHLYAGKLTPFPKPALIFLPIFIFGFVTTLYFFLYFYRENDARI